MLKTNAFANASAIVAAVLYVVCLLAVLLFPGFAMWYFKVVAHVLAPEIVRPTFANLNVLNALLGAVVFSGSAWLTAYLFASVYNKLNR